MQVESIERVRAFWCVFVCVEVSFFHILGGNARG